ncbi:hypothetical protein E2C01_047282 [Portunus trituberculatus]|uniref:Uncharacterized protein n=1 Tax=Portunus trituberculatus TaxID=210409 RepID=A0A5B7G381_PORTR|nr:hypothetical protein [Portunus trituberculatus]
MLHSCLIFTNLLLSCIHILNARRGVLLDHPSVRVPYCSHLSEKQRRLSCRDVEPMPSVEVVKEAFRSIRVSMGCTSQYAGAPHAFLRQHCPTPRRGGHQLSFLTTSLYPPHNIGLGPSHNGSSAFTSTTTTTTTTNPTFTKHSRPSAESSHKVTSSLHHHHAEGQSHPGRPPPHLPRRLLSPLLNNGDGVVLEEG